MAKASCLALGAGMAVVLATLPLGALHSQVTRDTTRMNGPAGPIAAVQADSAFIREARSGNLLERQLGQLALQRASNPAVKQFAQRMIDEHGAMDERWGRLVTASDLPASVIIDTAQVTQASRLQGLSGADFDRAYMSYMIQDHQRDVTAFQARGPTARSPEVRQLAASALPVLRQHLTLAQQLGSQVGATTVATVPPTTAPPTTSPTTVPPTTSPTTVPPTTQPAPADTAPRTPVPTTTPTPLPDTTRTAQNRNRNDRSQPADRKGGVNADRDYIRNVAAGNLQEIRMGQVAQRKAKDPEVRRFAERMVDEFTDWQNRWTGMAARNGMPFDPVLGRLHREKVERVENASGKNLDRVYMTTVIQHFSALLPYFQKEGRGANSAPVRRLVEDELPFLRQNLAAAKRIGVRVKADTTGRERELSNKR